MNFVKVFLYFNFLLISYFGYTIFLKEKLNIKYYFHLLIINSLIIVILYFFSIINFLDIGVWLLYSTGLVLFIYFVFIEKYKFKISIKVILLILLTYYFLYLLRNSVFVHFDNFTHWGIVVSTMLKNSRLPNLNDYFITYQSYPPGSSLFIYYINRTLFTESEGIMGFAQTFLSLGLLSSLFVFNRNNKIVKEILIWLFIIIVLTINSQNEGLYDLLVDNLISIYTIAVLTLIYYYRFSLKRITLPLIICLISLFLIKNSAYYFVLLILVYYFYQYILNKNVNLFSIISILTIPILVINTWSIHVKQTFGNISTSIHSVSLSNFESIFNGKSIEDIKLIFGKFIDFQLHLYTNKFIYVLISFILIYIVVRLFRINETDFKKYLISLILVYFSYQLGLLLMYLFTMPVNEAIVLAGIERYELAIIIIGIYTLLKYLCNLPNEKLSFTNSSAFLAIFLILLFIFSKPLNLIKDYSQDSDRKRLESTIESFNIEKGRNYLIYVSDIKDQWYFYFLSRYLLESNNISIINQNNYSALDRLKDFNYIIVLDEDTNTNLVFSYYGINEFDTFYKIGIVNE